VPGLAIPVDNRAMTPELKATLANLPDRPGVYLMKDARGVVLYVGKAQSLRSRVRSYWQKQAPSARGGYHQIRQAIDRVADLEVTEVDSVSEALLLEANLIKRYRPRFNVRLKDDKSYPYIKVTLGDDFPRIERTRKLPNDGSRYFGPYASASSVDEAMNLVRRLFPFRTCTIDIREGDRALARPCLLYHIKRCQGPCIEAIGRTAYRRDIAQVELFLEGNADTLLEGLRHEMHVASESEQYEKAAVVRDKIRSIERTMESQKMAAFARTELDLVAMARQDDQAAVQLFVVRNGKMLGRDVFFLDAHHDVADDEVLGQFLLQYYARATSVPREVLVPRSVTDTADLEAFLSARRGSLVHLRTPQRGEKRELMDLAGRNAAEALAREAARWLADDGRTLGALQELAAALELPGPPMRIECYDISNFQGQQSVGSMVVFEEGRPRTGEYRRFQIRTVEGSNDFASHQEVLRRRFRRTKSGEEGIEEERRWAMPDLVIIDGGRGQVTAAKEVLDELGLSDLPLVGLAKEREELIRPDRAEPVLLPVTSQALYLVQRLRDEAHRFAITYHRSLRNRKTVKSAFDDLPGVGPKRKRELLKVFGSAKRVREAPVEQIAAVPGISRALAERIKAHLDA
jgi:excinuclease ABC subunit C